MGDILQPNLIYKQLESRFVDDFQLPIQVVQEPYYGDRIRLFEDICGSQTKHLLLLELIRDRFGSDPQKFMEYRNNIRKTLLDAIMLSEAYKEFIADKSPIEDYKPIIGNNELYAEQQDGCMFISYDMVKANFQALRYANPAIVRDCETWEDFVGLYTDIGYFKASKQIRQETLGKLNGKRLASIEKYHSNEFAKEYSQRLGIYGFSLFSIKTDEIIFKFNGSEKEFESFKANDVEFMGFKFRVNKFKLHHHQFKRHTSSSILNAYEKEDYLNGHRRTLHCVPDTYYPQVYKLLNGKEINDSDLVFYFEHELCKFINPIELVK